MRDRRLAAGRGGRGLQPLHLSLAELGYWPILHVLHVAELANLPSTERDPISPTVVVELVNECAVRTACEHGEA